MFGRFSLIDKTIDTKNAASYTDKPGNHAFFGPVMQPDDSFEKQANEVSGNMVSSAAANNMFFKPSGNQIQRKQGDIMQDETGSGKSIDGATKHFMESGFGYDFGDVNIHNDEAAHRSAAGLSARAYTLGNDIVFGGNEYRPDTIGGRRLLAHELTHVVQQSGRAAGLNIQRTSGQMVQMAPVTGTKSSNEAYNIDADSMTQIKTGGKAAFPETNLSYDESSSTFTVVFPLAWIFPHAWDDSKRDAFVSDFEKSVRDAWDDRFILDEKGTKRTAHVKINFDENIVHKLADDWAESMALSNILKNKSAWMMDIRKVNVRSNVKGTAVELSENANKDQTHKGADLAAQATVLVHDGNENKTFTQNTSAHEFGHMIGLGDEYIPDDGTKLSDDSAARAHINNRIMNVGNSVTADVYAPFADWLSALTKTTWRVGKKVR